MPFHTIVKNMRINFPAAAANRAFYVEVARGVDVSGFKTGTLYGRLMDNTGSKSNENFQMKLVAFPIWEDDDANVRVSRHGLEDNNSAAPVLSQSNLVTSFDTGFFTSNSELGDIITNVSGGAIVASTLSMPAMRVLACFFNADNAFASAGSIVVSVGIALNVN